MTLNSQNNISPNRKFFFLFIAIAFLIRIYVLLLPFDAHYKTIAPMFVFVIRDVLWGVFFILTIFLGVLKKQRLSSKYFSYISPLLLFYLIYTMISGIHVFQKTGFVIVQNDWRNFVFYTVSVLLIIPFYMKSIKDFDWLFYNIILISIFIFIIGILLQYFLKSSIWNKRMLATMENPNTYGSFLVLVILLSFHKLVFSTKKKRMLIFVIINGLGLILTGSFQNIIALFFGLILLLISYLIFGKLKKSQILHFLLTVGSIGVGSIILALLFHHSLESIFSNFFNRFYTIFINKTGSSLTHRITQMHIMVKYFKNSSIMSFLWGDFYLNRYIKFDNQFYNIFINNGFLAVLFFVAVYCLLLMKTVYLLFVKYTINRRQEKILNSYVLPLIIYVVVFFFIISNFTAMFNRFPLNIIIGLSIGYITYFLYDKGDIDASVTY